MTKKIQPALVVMIGVGMSILFATFATVAASTTTSHDIRPGYGVSELRWLSEYLPALEGTPGDTPIYVMHGDEPGGAFLLLGGTHANEIAGVMAATLFVERATVTQGTVYVIPHANNSASSYNSGVYNTTTPQWFELTNSAGEVRQFRYGDRRTNPSDQEPDPDVFIHDPSGLELDGGEARNLNRNHPGKADGTLTQQISHALFTLVDQEEVDVLVDMHESSIISRLANMLVSHPRAVDIAAFSILDLEMEGLVLKQEVSSKEFFGLSHREFGDRTNAFAFLIESRNPGQEGSIINPDVVNDSRSPLADRVFLQLRTIEAILTNHALLEGSSTAIAFAFPFALSELRGGDLGAFLR
ncbi:succinylglutamate desuccinylase/aspartoacylase family protein [Candidatus Bipolaricaulota bacterium]|nr:succinylglutamate desuccinylase/aspartoacylase family protein [Candidatus Bipolaricaulota bacterium]